jgi:hypothetical protein
MAFFGAKGLFRALELSLFQGNNYIQPQNSIKKVHSDHAKKMIDKRKIYWY